MTEIIVISKMKIQNAFQALNKNICNLFFNVHFSDDSYSTTTLESLIIILFTIVQPNS